MCNMRIGREGAGSEDNFRVGVGMTVVLMHKLASLSRWDSLSSRLFMSAASAVPVEKDCRRCGATSYLSLTKRPTGVYFRCSL